MTRPPEYGQVAEWLEAIDADAVFLRGLEHGYYDIKYAADDGLTLARHVVEQWQFLTDQARRALDGIDHDGKSLDEVAAAYHDRQVAACALAQRALQQRIRALGNGDFEPSPWAASEAAERGISLEQQTGEDRMFELATAGEELAHLFDGDVREEEAEAWWAAGAGRAAAQDAATAGPGRQDHAVTGDATPPRNRAAAVKPAGVLAPTVSQAGYARVMAEAASSHRRRLSAQAEQACSAARAAGWADKDANEAARRAVHAAGVAVRQAGAANSSNWDIRWEEPRRAAMLAWHSQHPHHGQPAEAAPAAGAPAAARAELGRLFRAAADLMEQAGIPGLDVSCSPGRDEITVRVPEDCGDISSRIAVVDRLAVICGGGSAPVPMFGEGCDWISGAGQFAGHSVQVYTPSRPQPGKPPRADPALTAARPVVSTVAPELDFPRPATAASAAAHDGEGQAPQRTARLNRAVRAVRACLAKTPTRAGSLR